MKMSGLKIFHELFPNIFCENENEESITDVKTSASHVTVDF